jgi:predicted metallopeptidase
LKEEREESLSGEEEVVVVVKEMIRVKVVKHPCLRALGPNHPLMYLIPNDPE